MKTDVAKISKTTGIPENEIKKIKNYIFIEKHDLGEGEPKRFELDYMMAESWQRLIAGNPEKHDLTLIKHEQMERQLIEQGMSQDEAHIIHQQNITMIRRRAYSMVRLKNIEINGSTIECEIYPEDSKCPGHISIGKEEFKVLKYDLPPGYEWCINHVNHAKNSLVDMAKSGELSKEKLVMWY